MSHIDWSKAPEGATHFGPKHSYLIECWFRKAGAGWDLWEGGEWGPCFGGIQKLREDTLIKIPAKITPWTGEGLPPVGTECIITPYNTIWGFSAVGDYQCNILAYHNDFVWVDIVDTPGVPVATRVDKVEFKLICTPEQIAAEESAKVIDQMVVDSQHPMAPLMRDSIFAELYAQGYRKQADK